MNQWWTQLAPRERQLIAVAGALTALILGWQLLFQPMMKARAEARASLETADRQLSQIQEEFMRQRARGSASSSSAQPTPNGIDAFKAAVTGSAGDIGLSIARLQGNDTSSVRLVFENADPRLIFVWLEDVQAKHAAQVARFSMEQAGAGLVRANIDLVAGGL